MNTKNDAQIQLLTLSVLKSDSHPPKKKKGFICFNESPLKMVKNAYFALKAVFVLKIFNWSINSPRETVVDIVLDVLESSQGNVYIEVLSNVAAYQHGVC